MTAITAFLSPATAQTPHEMSGATPFMSTENALSSSDSTVEPNIFADSTTGDSIKWTLEV